MLHIALPGFGKGVQSLRAFPQAVWVTGKKDGLPSTFATFLTFQSNFH